MTDALATAAMPSGVKPEMATFPAALWSPSTHRFGHQAMASMFEILCVHEDANYARQAANQAFDLLDRLEGDLSRFVENSDITRINNLPVGGTVRVSRWTMECLMLALLAIEETGGAFDISLGTGLCKLVLRLSEYEVQANATGIRLDLGGIGKGYAVDRMAEVLVDWGIDQALIHGGCSSVRALQPPPGQTGWPLRIGLPGEHATPAYNYSASQCVLSASGLQKGNHILDPRGPNQSRLRPAAWVIAGTSVFRPALCKMGSVGLGGEAVSESPAALAEVFSTAFLMLSRQEVDACRARWPGLEALLAEPDDGVPLMVFACTPEMNETRREEMKMSRIESKTYLVVLGLACMSAVARAQLAPVPIELPKPGYEGTPANLLSIHNLEKPSVKQRPPFLAPVGVVNLAKGKKVTSTETDPVVGDLTMVTDGDTTQADGNYVELGPGVQSVTIDLGAMLEIYGVLFWHYFQPRVYFCIVVQTADDEAFTKNKQTWFNSDTANKDGQGAGTNMLYVESYEGKLVATKGVKARYVRLFSCGNNVNELNHYIEVEVFGLPAK